MAKVLTGWIASGWPVFDGKISELLQRDGAYPMGSNVRNPRIVHFDDHVLDLDTAELCRNGTKTSLQSQPFQILTALLEKPGQLVTREELTKRLWPTGTFVDFDQSLNKAVARLREALGDSAANPLYIETLSRRGYRWKAHLQWEIPRAVLSLPKPNDSSPIGKRISHDRALEVLGRGGMGLVYKAEDINPSRPLNQQEKHSAEVDTKIVSHPPAIPIRAELDRFDASDSAGRPSKQAISRELLYKFAAVAGILLLSALITVLLRHHPVHQRALIRVTFDAGLQTGATWSPDDRFIAYSSNRDGKFDIWVQPVSGGDAVKITHETGQNWQPEWSPDGRYIAYRSENGTGGLYIVPALGGTRRKIADFGYYPRWSPDSSRILFLPTTYGGVRSLYVVSLDGGEPHKVLNANFFAEHPYTGRSAAWHPDGKRISVYIWDYEKMAPIFWTVPLKGGQALKSEIDPELLKQFGDTSSASFVADTSFSWAPSGDAVYFERTFNGATNLWKMTVDPRTLRGTGMERLTTGVGHDTGIAVSADGKRVAFSAESRSVQIWSAPFDSQSGKLIGKGEPVTSPGIEAWIPSLTPDSEQLAFSGNRGGNRQIWKRSMSTGDVMPISSDDTYMRAYPVWSPEGTRLAYARFKKRGSESKIVVWSNISNDEQVIADGGDYDIYGWSHDGQELVVSKWNQKTAKAEVWLLSLANGSCTEKIAESADYDLFQGQFSPDGRWVAFEAVRDVTNGRESNIYVVSAHGGDWIRITKGEHWNDKPRWSPDGRTIYFVSGRSGFYNVWGSHFDPAKGRVNGMPFRITEFDNPALMIPTYIPDVGLSVGQRRIAVTISQSSGSIWVLNGVDE